VSCRGGRHAVPSSVFIGIAGRTALMQKTPASRGIDRLRSVSGSSVSTPYAVARHGRAITASIKMVRTIAHRRRGRTARSVKKTVDLDPVERGNGRRSSTKNIPSQSRPTRYPRPTRCNSRQRFQCGVVFCISTIQSSPVEPPGESPVSPQESIGRRSGIPDCET